MAKKRKMELGTCADCGQERMLQQHHVKGRQVDPDCVVGICRPCHIQHHIGYGVIGNASGKEWLQWLGDEWDAGCYPSAAEREAKSRELGYLPVFDCWTLEHPAGVLLNLLCPLWMYDWLRDEELKWLYQEHVVARSTKQELAETRAYAKRVLGAELPKWAN